METEKINIKKDQIEKIRAYATLQNLKIENLLDRIIEVGILIEKCRFSGTRYIEIENYDVPHNQLQGKIFVNKPQEQTQWQSKEIKNDAV